MEPPRRRITCLKTSSQIPRVFKLFYLTLENMKLGTSLLLEGLANLFSQKLTKSRLSQDRALLVTFTNTWSARKCLAKSSHLKSFDYPMYISQSLTGEQRVMEKKILSTRYNMIQSGKLRADFKIRDLKLYNKDELVQLPNDTVATNSVIKAN